MEVNTQSETSESKTSNTGDEGKDQNMTFEQDEKVLCFHGPLIYEAKILNAEVWTADEENPQGGPHYYVHYKGWKQTWDEWVPEERVLKFTAANLQRQKQLRSHHTTRKKSTGKQKIPPAESGADRGKKRSREQNEKVPGSPSGIQILPEEEYKRRAEVKIPIPDSLKIQLVDDWENVTKNAMLVALPCSTNVIKIIDDYRDYFKTKHSSGDEGEMPSEEVLDEVLAGLQLYFDKALGNILLYRFERQQYLDITKKHPKLSQSEIYGAEHLLRLFVQLPQLIAHTRMDQESVSTLKEHLSLFLKFLLKNKEQYFVNEYEHATPQYLQLQK